MASEVVSLWERPWNSASPGSEVTCTYQSHAWHLMMFCVDKGITLTLNYSAKHLCVFSSTWNHIQLRRWTFTQSLRYAQYFDILVQCILFHLHCFQKQQTHYVLSALPLPVYHHPFSQHLTADGLPKPDALKPTNIRFKSYMDSILKCYETTTLWSPFTKLTNLRTSPTLSWDQKWDNCRLTSKWQVQSDKILVH